jgi:hypothetical protein
VGTLVGALIAIVAGLGLAGGGTYVLIESSAPDNTVQFENAPVANNTGGVVNYGTP